MAKRIWAPQAAAAACALWAAAAMGGQADPAGAAGAKADFAYAEHEARAEPEAVRALALASVAEGKPLSFKVSLSRQGQEAPEAEFMAVGFPGQPIALMVGKQVEYASGCSSDLRGGKPQPTKSAAFDGVQAMLVPHVSDAGELSVSVHGKIEKISRMRTGKAGDCEVSYPEQETSEITGKADMSGGQAQIDQGQYSMKIWLR